jgi:hypothetical protein
MTQQAIREPHKTHLTAEEFLKRATPKIETLHVAELGGDVAIRAITLREREDILSGSKAGMKQDSSAFVALTLVTGMVEPKLTPQHVAEIKEKVSGVVDKIAKRIWELSGVEYAKDGATDVGDAAKNV